MSLKIEYGIDERVNDNNYGFIGASIKVMFDVTEQETLEKAKNLVNSMWDKVMIEKLKEKYGLCAILRDEKQMAYFSNLIEYYSMSREQRISIYDQMKEEKHDKSSH